MIYIHNNGKGWAVFKHNPKHPCNRPYAHIECTNEWSLISATYYETKLEAQRMLEKIQVGLINNQ